MMHLVPRLHLGTIGRPPQFDVPIAHRWKQLQAGIPIASSFNYKFGIFAVVARFHELTLPFILEWGNCMQFSSLLLINSSMAEAGLCNPIEHGP